MTEISFTVPGNPLPKPRPRINTKTHGAYVDQRYKDYESLVGQYAALAMRDAGAKPFTEEVGLRLVFRRGDNRGADLDNLEKLVADAMNKIVYKDDKLVVSKQSSVKRAHHTPGVDIVVMPIADFLPQSNPALLIMPEKPTLTVGKFTFAEQGLQIAAQPTFEEFDSFGQLLTFFDRTLDWSIGDFWNAAHKRFRDEALQLFSENGMQLKTVQNKGAVCKKFPPSRRREEPLHFSHHAAVAGLETPDQERFLDSATERGWTVAQLRLAVRKWRQDKLVGELFDDPRAVLGYNVAKLSEALADLWGIEHNYPGMELTLREMQNGIDGLTLFHDAVQGLETAA